MYPLFICQRLLFNATCIVCLQFGNWAESLIRIIIMILKLSVSPYEHLQGWWVNESLRVSDITGGTVKIFMYHARKGGCTTESNNDFSSPYPCKACETKERKTQVLLLRFFLSFFLSFIYIILYVTIIWQNLGGRKDGATTSFPGLFPGWRSQCPLGQ